MTDSVKSKQSKLIDAKFDANRDDGRDRVEVAHDVGSDEARGEGCDGRNVSDSE